MFGLHPRVFPKYPTVNIPYWPHRVLVIGRGRVGKNGFFHNWQVCCYPMAMDWRCPARIRKVAGQ